MILVVGLFSTGIYMAYSSFFPLLSRADACPRSVGGGELWNWGKRRGMVRRWVPHIDDGKEGLLAPSPLASGARPSPLEAPTPSPRDLRGIRLASDHRRQLHVYAYMLGLILHISITIIVFHCCSYSISTLCSRNPSNQGIFLGAQIFSMGLLLVLPI
jgi:hypothetical protein